MRTLFAGLVCLFMPGAADAAAVADWTRPWPHAEVPYRIAPELLKRAGTTGHDCRGWPQWRRASEAYNACKAMDAWQMATGVRFVADNRRLDKLDIVSGNGTDGTIGHWPIGNRIHIEAHPTYGAVLHEFGHVLGLMHEHQRSDRDRYLTLAPFLKDDLRGCTSGLNVCLDVMANFPVAKTQVSSPYDPCSLMHYLADQTPRHREDPRWHSIYSLTPQGAAALKTCAAQFAGLPQRCRKPGQKCGISRDDADVVRRFEKVRPRSSTGHRPT